MARAAIGVREPATDVTRLDLLGGRDADAALAVREDVVVSAAECARDVAALAERLPERGHAINLCTDRYWFIVAFAAALQRGHVTLMPPNRTPLMLDQLAARYAGCYRIVDGDVGVDVDVDVDVDLELDLDTAAPDHGAAGSVARSTALPAPAAAGATTASCSFAPDTPAAILFTSGSTGTPTPHQKSFGALYRGTLAAQDALGLAGLARGTPGHMVATVPPQHMYGLESSVFMPLLGGLVLDTSRPFFPADVLARLAALPEPRVLVTTPVHLRALLADAGALPRVARILCATAPLEGALARAAETRFEALLVEIYGCTEVGQLATRRTAQTRDWQLLPGVSLSQAGAVTFAQSGHGASPVPLADEIECTSPSTFRLSGRHADMINIGGKRASLADLNLQLQGIDGVEDGVFVVPDGEGSAPSLRLAALVVAPGLTPAQVLAALRERIDAAFLPRPLRLVASLPRNAVGKLPRAELQRLVVEAES